MNIQIASLKINGVETKSSIEDLLKQKFKDIICNEIINTIKKTKILYEPINIQIYNIDIHTCHNDFIINHIGTEEYPNALNNQSDELLDDGNSAKRKRYY